MKRLAEGNIESVQTFDRGAHYVGFLKTNRCWMTLLSVVLLASSVSPVIAGEDTTTEYRLLNDRFGILVDDSVWSTTNLQSHVEAYHFLHKDDGAEIIALEFSGVTDIALSEIKHASVRDIFASWGEVLQVFDVEAHRWGGAQILTMKVDVKPTNQQTLRMIGYHYVIDDLAVMLIGFSELANFDTYLPDIRNVVDSFRKVQ